MSKRTTTEQLLLEAYDTLARVRELRDELLRSDKAGALRIGRKLDAILNEEDE